MTTPVEERPSTYTVRSQGVRPCTHGSRTRTSSTSGTLSFRASPIRTPSESSFSRPRAVLVGKKIVVEHV